MAACPHEVSNQIWRLFAGEGHVVDIQNIKTLTDNLPA